MSAWLLNGLVAVPFAFAVLVRLLGAPRDRRGRRSRWLGGVVTLGWSVWAWLDASAALDGSDVDVPGSPSSACTGTSGSTGSAGRWC